MNVIRVTYPDLYNAGDLLNKPLVEKLSGKSVVRTKVYDADLMAVGGALFGIQYSGGTRGMLQKGLSLVYGNKPLYVWGAGFWKPDNPNKLYRKNLIVRALRGEKTREKLSGLTGLRYEDAVLADGGLLIDLFLPRKVEKKYKIGVVPHFLQKRENLFLQAESDPDYHFIEIQNTPERVAEEIASCEAIVSSSLHGLVFADSMHIPSMRLTGESTLRDGNFKFEDYYSAYGLIDQPWKRCDRLPDFNEIVDGCRMDWALVEEKKEALLACFPREL